MKSKKSLKIAILLFIMTFAIGAAFAATNGLLAFGGTVRINTATVNPSGLRVEIVDVTSRVNFPDYFALSVETVENAEGRQTIAFDLEIFDTSKIPNPVDLPQNAGITFANMVLYIQNTGDVPARLDLPTNVLPEGAEFGIETIFTFSRNGSGLFRPTLAPGETVNLLMWLSTGERIDYLRAISENKTFTYTATIYYEQAQ